MKTFDAFQGASITRKLKQDILVSQNGWNELMGSIVLDDHKLFNRLINDKSINLEETDDKGNTALILAAKNHQLSMIKELIKAGANIYHENNDGENFYDASSNTYRFVNKVKEWIEKKYPEIITSKKYNL